MKIKKIFTLALSLAIVLGMTGMVASAEGDVASIGTDTYATLALAVEAANAMDGDVTITLLQDTTFNSSMTISNNITIEGGNHTLYRYDDETDNTLDYTGGLFTVSAGANLNLNNLTIDGNNNWTLSDWDVFYDCLANNITNKDLSEFYTLEAGAPVVTSNNPADQLSLMRVNGSVTLNNSTITNHAAKNNGVGVSSLFYTQSSVASVTLNASTITRCICAGYNTVAFFAGEFIINEGTVISNNYGWNNGSIFRIDNSGKLIMNGGEIINNRSAGGNGVVMMLYGPASVSDETKKATFIMNGGKIAGNIGANTTSASTFYLHRNSRMIVNDGEISGNASGTSAPVNVSNATATLDVYSGYFNNTSLRSEYDDIRATNGKAFVYGGTYASDVDAYCAPGYTTYPVDEDDDGEVDLYKVVKMIEVEFEDVSDPNAEIERLYNINLITTDTNLVNKLEYIDLTFAFEETEKWIGYEINAVNENIDVHMVNNITPRYEFRFDELDTPLAETDKITIGQAKFTGYGEYTFAVDTTADTNAAYIRDDIEDDLVDTYIPIVVAGEGYLDIEDSVHEVVPMPKRNLKVNIMFPNDIEYKPAEYQKMTVKIAGGTVSKIINLGNESFDETTDGLIENPATVTLVDTNTDDGYSIVIDLPYETTYTVIVEGAGYRTARYSVNLTENKTLNFWNNVKNEETEVEVGHPDVKVKQNFLAGDIIKDDNINIYDMSAILSYFGARGISETNNPDYIKYDINRDGVIDAKDVAYILVSWGN